MPSSRSPNCSTKWAQPRTAKTSDPSGIFETAPGDRRGFFHVRTALCSLRFCRVSPRFRSKGGIRILPALRVPELPRHFLIHLIAQPIRAAPCRSTALMRIPLPQRFSIHKLIAADPRSGWP
ncbi:hypothetical protein FAZ78_20945 [Cereibacter changlensis]|uniref:Uncharacterized protein n=1 Tax=Cereibacter changlensis TaxID=402884 RepID=A0A4U0YQF5_9RHOB|nr:hypothetical protein FAZ78_20945 [Cereibacter changlensis]